MFFCFLYYFTENLLAKTTENTKIDDYGSRKFSELSKENNVNIFVL
jgi:hypothetical protein